MAIDFSRILIDKQREVELAAGATVPDTGLIIIRQSLGGVEAGKMSTGGGSDVPIGVSVADVHMGNRGIVVSEAYTIPAASPYTVQLPHTNIEASSYVLKNDAGTPLVENSGSNDYTLTALTGLITFNAALAGTSFTISYAWALTVDEAMDRGINPLPQAPAYLGKIPILCGFCKIFTTGFDTSQDYAVGDQLYAKADGLFGKTGGGAVAFGRVTDVPTNIDPYLGVSFNTTN